MSSALWIDADVELEVSVPSRVGEGADFAKWRLNGALRIRTADK